MGAREAVLAGVFMALVFAATLVSVETPITNGYFNLGESMVYTAAVIGGPLVGGVAGGLGSALADLYLGYGHYAPGTLVIKGVEGYLVGVLAGWVRRRPRGEAARLALAMALVVGAGIAAAGALLYGGLYGGETILYLLGRPFSFRVPLWAWILLGALVAAGIGLVALRRDPYTAALAGAMLAGGMVMVAGYFLYESLVLGYGMAAAAEIPVNVGQALVGTAIASGVVAAVREAGGLD